MFTFDADHFRISRLKVRPGCGWGRGGVHSPTRLTCNIRKGQGLRPLLAAEAHKGVPSSEFIEEPQTES